MTVWVPGPPVGSEEPSMWPTAICSTASSVPWYTGSVQLIFGISI